MKTRVINIQTRGNGHIINITPHIEEIVSQENMEDGVVFLNVIGSTAALTTMEYEAGLEKDIGRLLDTLIPYRKDWSHNFTWNDDNGHSHLRSMLLKTNLFIPVTDSRLELGTWQQVVLIDFDTSPRDRKIVAKIVE